MEVINLKRLISLSNAGSFKFENQYLITQAAYLPPKDIEKDLNWSVGQIIINALSQDHSNFSIILIFKWFSSIYIFDLLFDLNIQCGHFYD